MNNTSPHPPQSRNHSRPHDTPPKHKLPLNPSSPLPTRPHHPHHPHQSPQQTKRPHTAPSSQPPPIPSQPHPLQQQQAPNQPPPLPPTTATTTYTLSPGPTKPLPNPWQQLEEQALIQRELTAELLTVQGKNKGLVSENAGLRERIAQLERTEPQGKNSRLLQLESENHRLSGELARSVRGKYDTDSSAFDSILKEVAVLKKEQKRLTKHIEESTDKQEGLQLLLQKMSENEIEDKAALDQIVQITEQYTEHLREKTSEAEEALRAFQPELLQAKLDKSTGLITDTRQQITEIGESCASQNHTFAALRQTVETLQTDVQARIAEMEEMNNEVTMLISANEGQTQEIESLRMALHQTTLARDEVQGELERLRMRAATLEDEQHFLKTEYSSKNADITEKHSSQLRDLEKDVHRYRVELEELRAEHAMMEAALRESAEEPSQSPQTNETQQELARLAKLAETHLQAVRDAERTNMILEDQLRQKDVEISLLQTKIDSGLERVEASEERSPKKKKKKERRSSDSESESSGSEDSGSEKKRRGRRNRGSDRKCLQCSRMNNELAETKIELGALQQKLDKVKNLIQIYRQEKRQMEEYIEKEKRTAKSMIADVTTLREVLDEKQSLLAQLRDEVTHLRNEAARAQQTHSQQLAQAQDLARIQVQLKEDEVRSKLEVQATLQKEIQRLQAKLQQRKEELRAAQKAKKEADQTLEEQYNRLQMLDRNYVHTRHHHANYTSSAVSYLQSLESRIADMRGDVARTKQMQASCEDEVIAPLRTALQTMRALMQETMQEYAEEAQLQEQEMGQLRAIVSAMQHQPQLPQHQVIQHQQQIQQMQQQHQVDQEQLQLEIVNQQQDNREQLQTIQEQTELIDELKHEMRLLQLQLLEQQGVDKQQIREQIQAQPFSSREDVSQLYSHLEKTQELAEQLRIVSDESLYATEKLELLDSAQQHAMQELATQRGIFEEMRAANDAFMHNLEEQLWTLTQATPRYLDNLDDEEKLKLREPDVAMNKFVDDLYKEELTTDFEIAGTEKHSVGKAETQAAAPLSSRQPQEGPPSSPSSARHIVENPSSARYRPDHTSSPLSARQSSEGPSSPSSARQRSQSPSSAPSSARHNPEVSPASEGPASARKQPEDASESLSSARQKFENPSAPSSARNRPEIASTPLSARQNPEGTPSSPLSARQKFENPSSAPSSARHKPDNASSLLSARKIFENASSAKQRPDNPTYAPLSARQRSETPPSASSARQRSLSLSSAPPSAGHQRTGEEAVSRKSTEVEKAADMATANTKSVETRQTEVVDKLGEARGKETTHEHEEDNLENDKHSSDSYNDNINISITADNTTTNITTPTPTTNNNNYLTPTTSEQLTRKESLTKLDLSRVTSKDINSFISNINNDTEDESTADSTSMDGDGSEDEKEEEQKEQSNTARSSAVSGFNNFLSNFVNDSDSEGESYEESSFGVDVP